MGNDRPGILQSVVFVVATVVFSVALAVVLVVAGHLLAVLFGP